MSFSASVPSMPGTSIIIAAKMEKNEDPEKQMLPQHVPGKWRTGKKNDIRNHGIAMAGEFCGTFLFLFYAYAGAQDSNSVYKASDSSPDAVQSINAVVNVFFSSVTFGASVAVNVWAFYRVSGAHFNPAITLGLCLIRTVPWTRGLLLFPAQLLGAMAAAGVVAALFPGELACAVALADGTSIVRGLFIEMFLTIQLVFVVFMLAVEKHKATYLAPLAIGLALFITQMVGTYYTGGGVNPVRAFAPGVVNGFTGYQWIYWLGPFMGSFVAAGFYGLFKGAGYETANPGQDATTEYIPLMRLDDEAHVVANPTQHRWKDGLGHLFGREHVEDAEERGQTSASAASTLQPLDGVHVINTMTGEQEPRLKIVRAPGSELGTPRPTLDQRTSMFGGGRLYPMAERRDSERRD